MIRNAMIGKKNYTRLEDESGKFVNSFFTGIGGFDLAFERQGFKPTFHCENDDFCQSVLKRHWPEVLLSTDIRKLDSKSIPTANVWTAGFPCQDLSLARSPHGQRNGLKGTQSGLFYTFLNLLSTHKPPVVLLENVSGLLNSHKGEDFHALIVSLTQLGYAVAWRVLNARYFGAPQSRPRVFLCAWHGSPLEAAEVLFESDVAAKPKNERNGFMKEYQCPESGISVPEISFCISATSGRHTGLDWARSYVTYKDAVRRLTPLECERLQGLPDNWTLPNKDYVVPIRGIETNRYHAIGNAVCVPVVEWIAGRIANKLRTSSSKRKSRQSITVQLETIAKTLFASDARVQVLSDKAESMKWKSGGIAYKNWVVTHNVSPSIISPISSRLIDVLEKSKVHDRYFLSVNAVQGILRRVDRLGRKLFPPLDAALRKIAEEPTAEKQNAQQHGQDKKLMAL